MTYPGDPGAVIHKRERAPYPITSPDVLDTDWIPQVAARGWLIITRDSMITQNRNEVTAVRENNAKMVALNQRDAQTKWGQLEVFMTQWRRIETLTAQPGRFIWRTSRTTMTPRKLPVLHRAQIPTYSSQRRPDLLGAVAAFIVGVVPRRISGASRPARVRHYLAVGTHEPGFRRSARYRAERPR